MTVSLREAEQWARKMAREGVGGLTEYFETLASAASMLEAVTNRRIEDQPCSSETWPPGWRPRWSHDRNMEVEMKADKTAVEWLRESLNSRWDHISMPRHIALALLEALDGQRVWVVLASWSEPEARTQTWRFDSLDKAQAQARRAIDCGANGVEITPPKHGG